jgi:WhiB family redox-sensing transcriptional regulator
MGGQKTGGGIVGHCIGANGRPCGRPLASSQFARQLGVYENHGGMRCRSCWRHNRLGSQSRVKPLPFPGPWVVDGLCGEVDPDAFFPEKGESAKPAKLICRGCEVVDECLRYALEHHIREGVWGGLSAPERERLRQEQGQVAA